MQEGDSMTLGAAPGLPVDELDAPRLQPGELTGQIIGPVSDVVQSRPAPLEEATHGRIGPKGLEELEGPHERDADALSVEGLGSGTGGARQEFEVCTTVFDGVHGDAHVVEWSVRC
jgi:hypothetical protein